MVAQDEWSGLADLLANLIEKYAEALHIDELPDPERVDCQKTGGKADHTVAS